MLAPPTASSSDSHTVNNFWAYFVMCSCKLNIENSKTLKQIINLPGYSGIDRYVFFLIIQYINGKSFKIYLIYLFFMKVLLTHFKLLNVLKHIQGARQVNFHLYTWAIFYLVLLPRHITWHGIKIGTTGQTPAYQP